MAKERALEKLDEALRAAERGDGKEAFEDLSAARFHLFDEDCYTEPLVNRFDDALDIAWRLWRERISASRATSRLRTIIDSIKELIENPKGEKANPPNRVKTERDARLWDLAKWLVSDEYPEVDEGSERYWTLVSGIFTRLKLRLGGMDAKKVDEIVEKLQEKFGKLPPAGKHSKSSKEVEKVVEEVAQLIRKCCFSENDTISVTALMELRERIKDRLQKDLIDGLIELIKRRLGQ